ncbi:MAG: T9SS type A sorting domain-containing protein [Saprospiraceae bacterium]
MKTILFRCLIQAAWLLLACPLTAQWIPRAAGQYDNSDWVDQIRIADSSHIWAGITNLNVYYGWTTGVLPRLTHTTDGGLSWQTLTIPGTEDYLGWGLSLLGPDTVYWSLNRRASPNDRLYRSVDDGQTWDLLLQDTAAGYQVHFFNASKGLVYRGPYNTKYTTDGGLSWNTPASVPAGLADQGIFYYPGSDTEVEGNSFFAGLEDGTFLKTTDFGQTWQAWPTPLSLPLSDLAFENDQTGLAVSAFTVFDTASGNWISGGQVPRMIRTTDGGQNWTEIPTAQLPYGDQTRFISALAATGAPGVYILEARSANGGFFDNATFRSDDGGFTWQIVSTCPDQPLGVIEFLSPGLGWAGCALTQSPQDAMFFQWGTPPQPTTTFAVYLGDVPPSPDGVHLALDLNGWDPAAVPMTNAGGDLWTADVELPANTEIRYRFVNGLSLAEAEQTPEACGIADNGVFVRRVFTPLCRGLSLSPVLFGSCLPPGDLAPVTPNTPCAPVYVICDNFDAYSAGKLGPQSDIWTSYGCNFDGLEGDDCDVDLGSYDGGFTHYSGQWAMHPNSLYNPSQSQSIELNMGGLSTGAYELEMKMYVPSQRTGGLFFALSDQYSSVDFAFSTDGTVAYSKYSETDFSYVTEALLPFPTDRWFSLRQVFDLDAKHRACWIDSTLVFEADDADLKQLLIGSFSAYGETGEFFVDDLILRDLNAVGTGERPDEIILSISPNPATDFIRIRLPHLESAGRLHAQFTNARGQVCLQQPNWDGRSPLSISELPKGLYLLTVSEAEGRVLGRGKWVKI